MNNLLLALLVNHLWQSTLFAAAIAGLALLLRRNSAATRHALWLLASLKFLLPFALLAALATLIPWHPQAAEQGAAAPRILAMAGDFTAPLSGLVAYPQPFVRASSAATTQGPAATAAGLYWSLVALVVWALGAVLVAARWLVRWLGIRRILRTSVAITDIEFPVPVRSTMTPLEPGVVGIFRPVLLLPAGMEQCLTREQMLAVLAHERCHLRRRDNFTAAVHMLVEMLFWFYPPVWWIGTRLIDERERACDEQVVRDGHAPRSYAEGILAVCEHYIASRLPCVSGVSGADLRQRIESILRNTLALKLDKPRKFALATLGCCAVGAPIAAGIISGNAVQMLSSSAYTAAIVDYWKLDSTLLAPLNGDRTVFAESKSISCPAPQPEYFRRRNALAALAAKLSPTDGEKALLFAVAGNSTADVKRLLAGGASRSGDGFTQENSLMHIAARHADVPMLDALVDAGFGIDGWSGALGGDESSSWAVTPLMVAIQSGRMENVDWLIRHGADVSASNSNGHSALLSAMISCRSQALVTRLINLGAVPNDKARLVARNLRFDLGPPTALSVAARPVVPPKSAATRTAGNPAPRVSDEELRKRWLRPVPSELEAQPWRAESFSRYVEARADFDGDGREDQASLFNAAEEWQEGLFVKLSSQDPGEWQPVAQVFHPGGKGTPVLMGIRVARPGTYATACGKGNWTCGVGEPREVILTRPGIEYFRFESAGTLVYWDESARRFRQVWSSD